MSSASRDASTVASREREESVARLFSVEQKLKWLRRIAMVGWGLALLLEGTPLGVNAPWLAYALGVAYSELLHRSLRMPWNLHLVAWVSALGDSVLTFVICYTLGMSLSLQIPFFYFTVLATAFRFGSRKAEVILVFNTLLVITLFMSDDPERRDVKHLIWVLMFLGYSYVFGAMLAGWAVSNLRRALIHSHDLSRERDRSQDLLHSLINAQEEERKKLAADLHDRMGERFFAINRGLDECIRMATDKQLRARLKCSRTELLAFTSYIRSLMNELRPTVLDELGLSEAISEYVTMMRDIVPFAITTDLDPELRGWRSKEDAMLFRLVQEALLNIRKHAGAKSVLVGLRREAASVILMIADDGRGFDAAHTAAGHFGLMTMRERAEVSGGVLTIDSKPRQGTTVSVRFATHG